MGCGSSASAQPVAVMPAHAAQPHGGKPKVARTQTMVAAGQQPPQQQQQQQHQQPPSRTKTLGPHHVSTAASSPASSILAAPGGSPTSVPQVAPKQQSKPAAAPSSPAHFAPNASLPPLKSPTHLAPLKGVAHAPPLGAKPLPLPPPPPAAFAPPQRMAASPSGQLAPLTPRSSAPSFVAAASVVIAAQPSAKAKQKGGDKEKGDKKDAAPSLARQKTQFARQNTIKPTGGNTATPEPVDKFIHAVPIETLRALTGNQLNVIWSQYDTDGNGSLDRRELKLLASDCIARSMRMFEEQVRAENPSMSASGVKAAVNREMKFLLPSSSSSPEDAHKEMVKMLVRRLDVNGDGNVTKNELMMQWNSFSSDLFRVQAEGEGTLGCSIM